jgi:UDP-glucose 4-epimerase
VRYGNVLGSRGSVVPVFQQQIAAGGPVTVTDPSMTRFLMTLDDAVDLALRALSRGQNGRVLVRKAPACTVQTLAEACIRMFGGQASPQPEAGYPIRTIGTRSGERKHEILVTEQEMPYAEDMGDYYEVAPMQPPFDLEQDARGCSPGAAYTSENTTRMNVDQVVALLKKAELETREELT